MNRILVVDDEQGMAEMISEQVENLGFEATAALSAREALDLWKKERQGLVITDLNLGGDMDGISLCSRIRYEDHTVCVIAMSGYVSEYDLEYCLAAGFSDVLEKPIDLNDLNSSIQCNLERRQRWITVIKGLAQDV